ncbi:MAG: S1 RNA-binding domain-containing protein [Oscillospiraceae bacterium]
MVIVTLRFLPEGRLLGTPENHAYCSSIEGLTHAMDEKFVLEGTALFCDADRTLYVKLGDFTGAIPREDAAIGIADGKTREIAILSRVGKPVSFLVTDVVLQRGGAPLITLSRRGAQEAALAHLLKTLTPGDVLPATVTHLEAFGTFVDVGCGVPSMIGIENSSVSRLPHPAQRFCVGQEIFAVVLGIEPEKGRILLSHKELLGTWLENVSRFSAGMTVPGYVRGVKDYGLFVELAPNLSGLAEVRPGYKEGDRVSVYIKSILPEQSKIKLLLIDHLPPCEEPPSFRYFIRGGHLDAWHYPPPSCKKPGNETIFGTP